MAEPVSRRYSLFPVQTEPLHRPWLVIFLDPAPPGPGTTIRNRILYRLLTLLRPGFRHVMAVSPEGPEDQWLVVNPGSDILAIGYLDGGGVIAELQSAVAAGRARVVVVMASRPDGWRFRGLFTCVAAIAHLTGTRAGPFTTPWRFHRRLKRG